MTSQQIMARLRERDGDGELMGLMKRIASAHDVTLQELLDSRKAGPTDARYALWNALMERGHWSYSRIADVFGRDPSSVNNGVGAHRERHGLPPLVIGRGRRYAPPLEQALPTSKEVA